MLDFLRKCSKRTEKLALPPRITFFTSKIGRNREGNPLIYPINYAFCGRNRDGNPLIWCCATRTAGMVTFFPVLSPGNTHRKKG